MGQSIYSDPAADPNRKARANLAHVLRNSYGGPWTDNRWAQSEALETDVYLAIEAVGRALQGLTAQVTQLRDNAGLGLMADDDEYDKAFQLKALSSPHPHANDEQRKPVVGGPLVKLFECPNKRETLAAFLLKWRMQEMLTGNVIVWRNPDRAGRVAEMFVLPTALCQWQPIYTDEFPRGAWRVNPYAAGGQAMPYGMAAGALIDARHVTHYRRPHPTRLWDGLSPLTAASRWVDLVKQIDMACWASMDHGVNRGTTIVVPGLPPDEAEALNEKWRREKGGGRNSRAPLIIGTTSPESKPQILDPDAPKDMEYQQGRQMYAGLVYDLMGVPRQIVGGESTTYAGDYAAMKRFRDWTLTPWLSAVAAELTRDVASTWDDGDDDLKVQFDLPPFHNEEQVETTKQRQQTVGLVTFNEARRADNLPPVKDPDADVLPITVYLAKKQQEAAPPPEMPGGSGGPADQVSGDGGHDPDELLAGLGGDDAPRPDNPAGEGSLPPQMKAWLDWVEKARARAGAGRKEGEVWQTNGRYYTLKNGRTVPAKNPASAASAKRSKLQGLDDEGHDPTRDPGLPSGGSAKHSASHHAHNTKRAAALSGAVAAIKEAMADPSGADPRVLAQHLKTVRVKDLHELKKGFFKGGRAKSDLAQKFLDHIKGNAAAEVDTSAPADDSGGFKLAVGDDWDEDLSKQ